MSTHVIAPGVGPDERTTLGEPGLPGRIEVLDVLRGFSLLGIAMLNAPAVLGLRLSAADVATAGGSLTTYRWSELLLQGHFFPIFSLLFGVSFALLMAAARSRGQPAVPVFLRRLGVMAVFGLLHHQLQPGEVLLPYAVFGLLLVPYERLPLRLVLGTSALISVLALWTTPVLLTPAMFLLGLALHRLGVFEKSSRMRPLLRWVFPVLALGGVALTAWQFRWTSAQEPPLLVVAGQNFDPGSLTGLVCAGALTTGVWLLVIRSERLPLLLRPLALIGRLSLSNYVLQTLVFAALSLAGARSGPYWLAIPASLLACTLNFTFSAWWLPRYQVGPLEWLWRWGTTLRRPELKRPLA